MSINNIDEKWNLALKRVAKLDRKWVMTMNAGRLIGRIISGKYIYWRNKT